MPYVAPADVIAPQRHISDVKVLFDGGPGGWSLARLRWDGQLVTGIRWNGGNDDAACGNPQSHGRPTWFLLPSEAEHPLQVLAEQLRNGTPGGIFDEYRAMVADQERESAAWEWTEGLMRDASDSEG
ncbi:MAG TPA: hypothetical protein VN515_08445 [Terriglobales bacterium]|nr:hypothetical protein [Terriglobales bacterium]